MKNCNSDYPNIIAFCLTITLFNFQVQQAVRQNSTSAGQRDGQSSPAIQVVTAVTKTVTMATSSSIGSPVTVISSSQASASPLVARLMQQMSGKIRVVNMKFISLCQH